MCRENEVLVVQFGAIYHPRRHTAHLSPFHSSLHHPHHQYQSNQENIIGSQKFMVWMKTLKENAFHCNYLQLAVFKHLGLKPFGRCHIIGEQSLLQYLQYLAERSFTWWHAALFGRELRWGSSGSMWGCHERQGLQFCTDCAIRVLYIKKKLWIAHSCASRDSIVHV